MGGEAGRRRGQLGMGGGGVMLCMGRELGGMGANRDGGAARRDPPPQLRAAFVSPPPQNPPPAAPGVAKSWAQASATHGAHGDGERAPC